MEVNSGVTQTKNQPCIPEAKLNLPECSIHFHSWLDLILWSFVSHRVGVRVLVIFFLLLNFYALGIQAVLTSENEIEGFLSLTFSKINL